MNVRVKICGITNIADAKAAARAGADYLGFIFHPKSPRSVTPNTVKAIISLLRAELKDNTPIMVGVFVDESVNVIELFMDRLSLNLAQLSGDEPPEHLLRLKGRAYKAIHPQTVEEAALLVAKYTPFVPMNENAPSLLVDSYHPAMKGGTGEMSNPAIVTKVREMTPRLMLAGGLTPENIAEQIKLFHPFAVDVASGVEAEKGRKDHAKVRDFINNVHALREDGAKK